MKAILIDKFVGSYDEIKVSNVPIPEQRDGEVIVKVIAAGVNFVDLLYARGKHQNNHRKLVVPPFILGLEFAGTVIHAPPGSRFSEGDRVFGGSIGSYAEQIAVKETSLHHIPPRWSFSDAAGLAATAPVSYGGLITRGGLKKGETVLIHAAAGGLGIMAVQIAKAAGAKVIATAGSKEKLEIARRFGADACVSYTDNPDWWKEVLEITGGEGVDIVYDPVGLVDKSLKCLKQKGRIILIGFAGTEGNIEKIAMNRILLRQAQLIGYRAGKSDSDFPSETIETWRGLREMLEKEQIQPTVFDREYHGLEDVVTAMKDLEKRQVWGKAVINLEPSNTKSRL